MGLIETAGFARRVVESATDEEYREFPQRVIQHPEMGSLIKGAAEARKVRMAVGGRGKRGGARVIYYPKGVAVMRDDLFQELLESVKEAGAIRRGEKTPSRRTTAAELGVVDIREVRARLKLSGPRFAQLLGISPRTLEGWEQKRRSPDGAARVLIYMASQHPEMVLQTVKSLPAAARGARGGAPKKKKLARAS